MPRYLRCAFCGIGCWRNSGSGGIKWRILRGEIKAGVSGGINMVTAALCIMTAAASWQRLWLA